MIVLMDGQVDRNGIITFLPYLHGFCLSVKQQCGYM